MEDEKKTNRDRMANKLKDGASFGLMLKRLSRSPLDYMDWDKWLDSTDPKPIYKDVKKARYTDDDGKHWYECLFVFRTRMSSAEYCALIIPGSTDPLKTDFNDQFLKVPAKNVVIDD